MDREKFRIAIETGVSGGSLSLIKDNAVFDQWINTGKELRFDYFLQAISYLLEKNNIKKNQIEKIYYSDFPGSQTGLKIGASTAKGLGLGLDIEYSKKNLFDSISRLHFQTSQREILIIFPIGNKNFVWKMYQKENVEVKAGQFKSIEDFAIEFKKNSSVLYMFSKNNREMSEYAEKYNLNVSDLGTNLSRYLGIK